MELMELLRPKGKRVTPLPVDQIEPNPAQPRRQFDPEAITRLAESIAENGLLSPISVRRVESGKFQLIAGERRLMAFRLLGEEKIPALIEEADDRRSAVLALVENLQRQELSFLEEACAIAALIEAEALTQREAAARLGLSQSAVANKLRLLKLPPEVLGQLAQEGFSERHARALLPLCDRPELLEKAVRRMIAAKLTVAQTERLTARLLEQPASRGARLLILKDLRLFTGAINRAIETMQQAGIHADAKKTEDETAITYTIVIPKAAQSRPTLRRDQAAPIEAAL